MLTGTVSWVPRLSECPPGALLNGCRGEGPSLACPTSPGHGQPSARQPIKRHSFTPGDRQVASRRNCFNDVALEPPLLISGCDALSRAPRPPVTSMQGSAGLRCGQRKLLSWALLGGSGCLQPVILDLERVQASPKLVGHPRLPVVEPLHVIFGVWHPAGDKPGVQATSLASEELWPAHLECGDSWGQVHVEASSRW